MRALVVYESMYGNTRGIAQAIAEGISERLAVKAVEVAMPRWTFRTTWISSSLEARRTHTG